MLVKDPFFLWGNMCSLDCSYSIAYCAQYARWNVAQSRKQKVVDFAYCVQYAMRLAAPLNCNIIEMLITKHASKG